MARVSLSPKLHVIRAIHLVVDCVFFGKKETSQWGVIVFRDAIENENLWWRFIDEEKLVYYIEGREYVHTLGYTILSVTLDGFRGLGGVFQKYPIQFCHFHQKQIIRRYVTQHPRLIAGVELQEIIEMLGELPKDEFTAYLQAYINHYRAFLNQKTTDPSTGRWTYTHKRLRSAIRSLLTNVSCLFTHEQYPQLNIPTTTNSLESHFSHIKDIIRVHRGLKRRMKQKVITAILLNSSIVKSK